MTRKMAKTAPLVFSVCLLNELSSLNFYLHSKKQVENVSGSMQVNKSRTIANSL